MSALTPHIRMLRALGDQYERYANGLIEELARASSEIAVADMLSIATHFHATSFVHRAAADQLVAEEAALQPPREGTDKEITFNQKGKP